MDKKIMKIINAAIFVFYLLMIPKIIDLDIFNLLENMAFEAYIMPYLAYLISLLLAGVCAYTVIDKCIDYYG